MFYAGRKRVKALIPRCLSPTSALQKLKATQCGCWVTTVFTRSFILRAPDELRFYLGSAAELGGGPEPLSHCPARGNHRPAELASTPFRVGLPVERRHAHCRCLHVCSGVHRRQNPI